MSLQRERQPEPPNVGMDGGIANFIDDIADTCRQSNGYVIEVGVATGTGSTVAIQRGLAEHATPLHISVDQRDCMTWKPNVPWWKFVIGDSRSMGTMNQVELLADMSRRHNPGVIYIDTDHDYGQMKAELEVWGWLARSTTVFLFHDTWMFGTENGEMIRAIKEWAAAHSGWVYEDWRTEPHGLGRMRCLQG